MIQHFEANTADEVWRSAAAAFLSNDGCLLQESRLGPVREYLHCSLHLHDPRQRWVLSRRPAMNPAFAIAELVWILQGRNDAAFLNFWNPLLPKFAGYDEVYYGAYGKRLRDASGLDQIERAYRVLAANPASRQVVLQIWDSLQDMPNADGGPRAPDIPCNIIAMPKIRAGKLEWLQVMRSNDLFLGTPHNFVQFTSLQEIMAGWLGIEVGSFVLIADSLHLYEHDLGTLTLTEAPPTARNTDTLALPKDEFDRILPTVERTMDKLRSNDLIPANLAKLLKRVALPPGWHNLLCIVTADTARRRGWRDEMEAAASQCTNPALNFAWLAWVERCSSQ